MNVAEISARIFKSMLYTDSRPFKNVKGRLVADFGGGEKRVVDTEGKYHHKAFLGLGNSISRVS